MRGSRRLGLVTSEFTSDSEIRTLKLYMHMQPFIGYLGVTVSHLRPFDLTHALGQLRLQLRASEFTHRSWGTQSTAPTPDLVLWATFDFDFGKATSERHNALPTTSESQLHFRKQVSTSAFSHRPFHFGLHFGLRTSERAGDREIL